jgi:hypothetical protein
MGIHLSEFDPLQDDSNVANTFAKETLIYLMDPNFESQ